MTPRRPGTARTTPWVTSGTALTTALGTPVMVRMTLSVTPVMVRMTRRVTAELRLIWNGRAPRDVGPGRLSSYWTTRRALAVLTVMGKGWPVTLAAALIGVQGPPLMLYSPL